MDFLTLDFRDASCEVRVLLQQKGVVRGGAG